MANKVITVPKDNEAQKALDYDTVSKDQLIELELDEASFENLFTSGIINHINVECNCNIDDFEDESIFDVKHLEKALVILNSYTDENVIVLPSLKNLFNEALKRKTSVHFYF